VRYYDDLLLLVVKEWAKMQLQSETSRGADYFKSIVEIGKTLKVSAPVKLSQSDSYLFEIKGFDKRWDMCLTSGGPGSPGQSRQGTWRGRAIGASLNRATGDGSKPSEQWCALERRSLAWFQVPCAKQWLTVGGHPADSVWKSIFACATWRLLEAQKASHHEQATSKRCAAE
jgi:hypothetical protein